MHASTVGKMEVDPILCSVPQGCRVLGIDSNKDRVERGMRLGLDAGVVLSEDDPHQAIDHRARFVESLEPVDGLEVGRRLRRGHNRGWRGD